MLERDQKGSTGSLIALSPLCVTYGSAQYIKYPVECPVWSKFEESPFNALQTVAFDCVTLVYSTEGKMTNIPNHVLSGKSDCILKVEMESSDGVKSKYGYAVSVTRSGKVK